MSSAIEREGTQLLDRHREACSEAIGFRAK